MLRAPALKLNLPRRDKMRPPAGIKLPLRAAKQPKFDRFSKTYCTEVVDSKDFKH